MSRTPPAVPVAAESGSAGATPPAPPPAESSKAQPLLLSDNRPIEDVNALKKRLASIQVCWLCGDALNTQRWACAHVGRIGTWSLRDSQLLAPGRY